MSNADKMIAVATAIGLANAFGGVSVLHPDRGSQAASRSAELNRERIAAAQAKHERKAAKHRKEQSK